MVEVIKGKNDLQIVQRGASRPRMNANTPGHPETTRVISTTTSEPVMQSSQFVKFPNTYEGGFISSLGVAIGSATMTTRQSLSMLQATES